MNTLQFSVSFTINFNSRYLGLAEARWIKKNMSHNIGRHSLIERLLFFFQFLTGNSCCLIQKIKSQKSQSHYQNTEAKEHSDFPNFIRWLVSSRCSLNVLIRQWFLIFIWCFSSEKGKNLGFSEWFQLIGLRQWAAQTRDMVHSSPVSHQMRDQSNLLRVKRAQWAVIPGKWITAPCCKKAC